LRALHRGETAAYKRVGGERLFAYAQANMHRVGGGHGGELQTVVSTAGSGYELEP
jgi:hypothetical protein